MLATTAYAEYDILRGSKPVCEETEKAISVTKSRLEHSDGVLRRRLFQFMPLAISVRSRWNGYKCWRRCVCHSSLPR